MLSRGRCGVAVFAEDAADLGPWVDAMLAGASVTQAPPPSLSAHVRMGRLKG